MTPPGRGRPARDPILFMRIKCTNEQTRSLKLPFMSEPVEFASTGTAQVEQELGMRLVDELDAIQPYENTNK